MGRHSSGTKRVSLGLAIVYSITLVAVVAILAGTIGAIMGVK